MFKLKEIQKSIMFDAGDTVRFKTKPWEDGYERHSGHVIRMHAELSFCITSFSRIIEGSTYGNRIFEDNKHLEYARILLLENDVPLEGIDFKNAGQ